MALYSSLCQSWYGSDRASKSTMERAYPAEEASELFRGRPEVFDDTNKLSKYYVLQIPTKTIYRFTSVIIDYKKLEFNNLCMYRVTSYVTRDDFCSSVSLVN